MVRLKIDVPLLAKSVVNRDKQYIEAWHDSKKKTVECPIKPYIYLKDHPDVFDEFLRNKFWDADVKKAFVTPLGQRSKETWYKVAFDNEIRLKSLNKMLRESRGSQDPESLEIQNRLDEKQQRVSGLRDKLIDKVLIERPDFYKQFGSQNLKIMVLDIEQWSDGTAFPDQNNPLLSISMLCTDQYGVEESEMIHVQSIPGKDGDFPDDSVVVKSFVRTLLNYDCDIIVGYNSNGYDLPVLLRRMASLGIDERLLDRERRRGPFFYDKKMSNKDLRQCLIGGRVAFDIMHNVLMDQTLNGMVKNKKLKTIAKYFKAGGVIPDSVEIVEEDMHDNRHLVGTPELKRYNNSDVAITKYLFDMYFKNNLAVAEFVGCPLGNVVPMASSYPFTIEGGRVLYNNGIISTGRNVVRNQEYWPKKGKPFQAAFSDCVSKGRYEDIFEADISSQYPSVIVSLGIGPDNTRILRKLPFDKSYKVAEFGHKPTQVYEVRARRDGDKRIYQVPDTVRNFIWEIEVDGYSPIAKRAEELLSDRLKLKAKAKTAETEGEREAAYIRAYGLKVVLNSFFGGLGDEHNPIGQLGAAALITGVSRCILNLGINFVGKNTVINFDTDGVKTSNDLNVDKLNEVTSEYMNSLHGRPVVRWEKDPYQVIYSHKAKNYLLLDEKGKLVKKGVAFHSSKLPLVFDEIIDTIGPMMLKLGHESTHGLVVKYYNVNNIPTEQLVQTVKVGMPYEEYKNSNGQVPKLMVQYKELIGHMPKPGFEMPFIMTLWGCEPPSEAAFNRIDTDYYRDKVINRAVQTLGFKQGINMTLDKWL